MMIYGSNKFKTCALIIIYFIDKIIISINGWERVYFPKYYKKNPKILDVQKQVRLDKKSYKS